MENVDVLTGLINTVGFPIVVCLILFWFIKNFLNRFINTLEKFSEKLENNSKSLDKLTTELNRRNDV